ncbi:MAG: sigma-70 family RNA polymerase sigma factor [Enterocloster asparagiformis]|nr:sigma-70 family RNA polymerase sigma factor [Enterocloster asparagiformis]
MGTSDEIEALYRQYSAMVYAYLLSMCRNRHVAEDILQSTFLQVIKGITGFRGDSSVKTWIFTIARNEYFRWLRRNPPVVPLDESMPVQGDLAGDYQEKEQIRAVFRYLDLLEEPLRSLMYFRIFGGLSFRETAAMLGKTEVWCRVNFMRCKNRLLEQLEEE